MRPLISVITVNRNNANGLRRTLTSVASQSYPSFEHIVVDGNSTDGSRDVLRSENFEIDRWVSESDSGIYNAMNKGIAFATGEYLLFINSGDHFLEPDSLAKSAPLLIGADLHYFSLEMRKPEQSEPGSAYIHTCPRRLTFSYLAQSSLPHPATFIRADLFQRFGRYDESLKICSDWKAFILWVCRYNCSYRAHEQVLSIFYTDGLSSSKAAADVIVQERENVLAAEFPAFVDDLHTITKSIPESPSLQHLRESRWVRLLQRFGLLWKF